MQINYRIAGTDICFYSPEDIISEGKFSLFRREPLSVPQEKIIITRAKLPEKRGERIFSSLRKTVYKYKGTIYIYSAYFDTRIKGYKEFACLEENPSGRELFIDIEGSLREVAVFEGFPLPRALISGSSAVLHCSHVCLKGESILFAGRKQVGKSTQAALWEKYMNSLTVNGDRAAVKLVPGGFYACGVPHCGTSGICRCGNYPLKSIILLEQGRENILTPCTPGEVLRLLTGNFTYDVWDREFSQRIFELTEKLAYSLPVYKYSCLKDESAVKELYSRLWK